MGVNIQLEKRTLKRISLFLMLAFILSNVLSLGLYKVKATATYASNLFFSEYIEGSSYNKAIEIFNGTANDMDLSQYSVELYSNGSSTAGATLNLSGTLARGDVYIIANSQASAAILALADATSGVANFNGDDALVLKQNGAVIDSFGQVGIDPGNAWGTGDNTTIDHTLVRKSSITAGDPDSLNAFEPTLEWDIYPKDDITHLGTHTMDGFGEGNEQVAEVTAVPAAGAVNPGTEVTLSTATEGAAIYYTIDGSDPNPGTLYTAPIVINTDITVKAKAVKEGMEDSNISSFSYTLLGAPVLDTIASARIKPEGTIVRVQGTVSRIKGNNKFIQDGTAGICIYQSGLTLNEGDLIEATGTLDDYNGLLEMINVTATVISSGNTTAPREVTVSQAAEDLESQLIIIRNAAIGAINTNGNTPITDSTGTINIYKVPALTNIVQGDIVDVIALVGQYNNTYQLTVARAGDITLSSTGTDTVPPVITHTPVSSGSTAADLTIGAVVTDNRGVQEVKLYYRTVGQTEYRSIIMSLADGNYTGVISRSELNTLGLEYYIEAKDAAGNISTSPADITHPYQVIISDLDVDAPEITDYSPKSGASTGNNLRPVINIKYTDRSGINIDSIKLYINGTEITSNFEKTETELTYTPPDDLTEGEQTVRVTISDRAPIPNTQDFTWNFYVGEIQYNLYFGQIHSHTNLSDGQGTPDEAYTWARDRANADFFAVTDHSNSFDNDKDSENIKDYRESTSQKWKQLRSTADRYNVDNEFVAIGGYEMTWSGSTGGWGHINTFNTEWFASRNNSSMTLQKYYEKIGQDVTSISQLNHPGTTFGDFGDFGFWTPEADRVVNLIEVGNGEGTLRSSGYFPSYESYTRALDKGWHVAPTNNQDNHKGNWVTANPARTVILAQSLTRQSLYEAMSKRRVYATEDENLRIKYTVNGQAMGTILQSPDMLNISIDINDIDAGEAIGKVSIIANGGRVVAEKNFASNTADWDLQISPQYSYYYVRVDQPDKDIAVTAPVWAGEVVPAGISNIEVSQNPQIVNTPTDITATVYNNGTTLLSNIKVEFYKDSIVPENKIGEKIIPAVSPSASEKATIIWAPNVTGNIKIYAQAVINIGGQDKTFTESTIFMVANPEDITKVVIDGGHQNQYVTGDYPGNIKTLAKMLTDKNIMLVQNKDELTASDFENAKLLFLTDPGKTVNYSEAEIAAIQEFISRGGSLIITSRADYNDRGVTDPALNSAAQGNRILDAIGSELRFNDDEVIDNVSNGGLNYRLYFDDYTSAKYNLTDNIIPGYTYSAYSGCSVILRSNGSDERIDWLVKGHDTTETLDSDSQGDAVPVTKGDVYTIAAETLSNGSKVIVSGTTFFSDFETATSDNAYSNKQITDNIINWLVEQPQAELKKIAEVRADANGDGVPDLMGQKFRVEGIVTAQSVGVGTNNSFFDVIYVQDETGGITIFGVSAKPVPLGARISVTGTVGQYEGDSQIQIKNEDMDIVILDPNPKPIEPLIMTTGNSMLEENEGWLVKIEGEVRSINTTGGDNSLYIDDGSGTAKVYVNGYIGDGTDNPDMLGKWDPNIKVGCRVSAIGLASQDAAGHRIRVRNTAEIIKLSDPEVPVTGISLDNDKLVIKTNNTAKLTATVTPENATNKAVVWTSDNEEVAAVDSEGNVTGMSTGIAEITAQTADGQYKASCHVYVTPSGKVVFVTGITLSKDLIILKPGSRGSIKATILPKNATFRDVIWTSSDSNIVEVDNNGNLKAKSNVGNAVITVKTKDGGFTAQCRVIVTDVIVKGIRFDKTNVTMTDKDGMNTTELVPRILSTPSNGSTMHEELEVTSDKPEIASAVLDEDGKVIVTAHTSGQAVITVRLTQWNYTARCIINVVPVTGIQLNKTSAVLVLNSSSNTIQLNARVLPDNAAVKDVIYSSDDENVAVVDARTGLVTATGIGSATITATTVDGNLTAKCNVEVIRTPVSSVAILRNGRVFKSGVFYANGPREWIFQVAVLPEDATIKDFIVASSNEAVVKVETRKNEDGTNRGEIVVTVVGRGRARIMVKTIDGDKTAFCDIYVK